MVYTEVLERNGKKYFYRVESVRKGKKVLKRKKYLGVDLDKKTLSKKEEQADKDLGLLGSLLEKKELEKLEKLKKQYLKEPNETKENRYEAFVSLFTYDSVAIEGNTLSLQETSQLLFDDILPQKSLREVNETLNHKKTFDYVLNYKGDITKEFICKLHEMIVKETLRKDLESQIGKFRISQVFIRGVEWLPTRSSEVPKEMKSLLAWYSKNKNKLHPLILASYFHVAFETIHPFVDGNGRVGRLLLNFILHKNKYPMVNIPNKIKRRYYDTLGEAQVKGNLRPFMKFIFDLLMENKILF